jgi:hypothetical protein
MTRHRRSNHKTKKSRKHNFFQKSMKNIRVTSAALIPKVGKGLENVGTFVTNAAIKSAPMVEKSLENTFNVLKKTSKYAVKQIRKRRSRIRTRRRSHKK